MQAIEVVWLLSNPDHQEHKSASIEVLLAHNRTQSTFLDDRAADDDSDWEEVLDGEQEE